MIERLGVFEAMNRSWELTRQQSWRLLGIIVTAVTAPFSAAANALLYERIDEILRAATGAAALGVRRPDRPCRDHP